LKDPNATNANAGAKKQKNACKQTLNNDDLKTRHTSSKSSSEYSFPYKISPHGALNLDHHTQGKKKSFIVKGSSMITVEHLNSY
jgi:hypothetical protein